MLTVLAALALLVQAPAAAPKQETTKPYIVGSRVTEEPRLSDLAGKEHALFSENKDKLVLLVFWSWKDPVSRLYAPRLAALQQRYPDKLALLLVDSNYDELVAGTDPVARMKQVLAAEKVTLPVYLDKENRLADDFHAVANAEAFLLDTNRVLRYHGGIDDDPRGERKGLEPQLWLEKALENVLAGEKVALPETRPAGRALNRATPSAKPAATPPAKGPARPH